MNLEECQDNSFQLLRDSSLLKGTTTWEHLLVNKQPVQHNRTSRDKQQYWQYTKPPMPPEGEFGQRLYGKTYENRKSQTFQQNKSENIQQCWMEYLHHANLWELGKQS